MAISLGILALAFMGFAGYTLALQRLFHLLLEQARPADDSTVHRTEAVVLLRLYINKLNLAFALGLLVYMIVSRNADWHYGVLLVSLCILGGNLLSITYLQPRTPRMLAALSAELETRRKYYQVRGKADQIQAVDTLLARLRSLNTGLGQSKVS